MHTLLVGAPGVGKSTLIRRVLAELDRPVFGFETKKETAGEGGGGLVYLYPAGGERRRTGENLAGRCGSRRGSVQVFPEVFDRFAPRLRGPVPAGHVVLMDELGFMEAGSEAFCDAVFALLDGEAPVLAAVKDRAVPFLDRVRAHPKCRSFFLTPENRERMFVEVLEQMRLQLGGGQGGR